ncbi:MAG: bifunctional 4-hydroxy-2-oxoglutarate aldolase/2-dehydro-3-deoxy-phosphogluconate aldolase [Actinomycetes bacterium]|nr:bifunctional 4-hydroxy-2-oxoglutarate aldolase/2-dehydro-3-deoxy-phosphogluconate aldolase [Actinomycetota bacterium]
MNVIDRLISSGAVAIVRGPDQKTGQQIADAIVSAGLSCIEVTMTNPGAFEIITSLAKRDGVCVGVGTILDPADVLRAKNAGASFIVSPNTDPAVISATKSAGLLSIPGIASATDVAVALKAGADVLKLFPASTYGPGHLKALRDPFPGNIWCPTGGMTTTSVAEWFAAGASLVGLGGPLTKGGIGEIGNNVQGFLNAISAAKQIR